MADAAVAGHAFVFRLQPSEMWKRLPDGRMLVDSVVRGPLVVGLDGRVEHVEIADWVELKNGPLATGRYRPLPTAGS